MGSTEQSPGRHHHPDPPLPHAGSCAGTTGCCLRTSCCRLESSQSSGRTWVGREGNGVRFPGDPNLRRTWKELRWSSASHPCSHRPHVSLLWQQDLGAVPELLSHCGPPRRPPDSYPLGLAQPCSSRSAFLAAGKQIQIPLWPPYLRA